MPDVFLSYTREDFEEVARLYSDLSNRDLSVFWDGTGMQPGDWMPQITKNLEKARCFVFCLSAQTLAKLEDDHSVLSYELNTAIEHSHSADENIVIIPVKLEEFDIEGTRLAEVQGYDLFPSTARQQAVNHIFNCSRSDRIPQLMDDLDQAMRARYERPAVQGEVLENVELRSEEDHIVAHILGAYYEARGNYELRMCDGQEPDEEGL